MASRTVFQGRSSMGLGVSVVDVLGELLEGPLGGVDEAVRAVALVDQVPALRSLSLFSSASSTSRPTSSSVRPLEAVTRIACFLPVPRSCRGDVHDAVGIDVEGDLDLRHAARRRRDADELESPEGPVVAGHFALALHDMDANDGLGILGGGENLAVRGGDRRIALDDRRGDTPPWVSTPNDSGVTSRSRTLATSPERTPPCDRRARGHDLVGIHRLAGRLAEDRLDLRLDPPACASCRPPGSPRRSRRW